MVEADVVVATLGQTWSLSDCRHSESSQRRFAEERLSESAQGAAAEAQQSSAGEELESLQQQGTPGSQPGTDFVGN